MAEQSAAFDTVAIPTKQGMYLVRVWLWERRRRRMARRMGRQGAAVQEVISALYTDALINPPPRG